MWGFDFVDDDGRLGGFVALSFLASARRAWYWAGLVGAGRPYLLVRDLTLSLPRRPGSREVRGDGLWADVNCETPHDHWSIGLEAFGVALDDPADALGDERGNRIGLGLDLEWDAAGEVVGAAGDYEQFCRVHGEVLVGVGRDIETVLVAGQGWRRHTWGAVNWAATPWSLRGGTADGRPFVARTPSPAVEVLHRAPLRLGDDDGSGHLERTLVSFADPAGFGWTQVARFEC